MSRRIEKWADLAARMGWMPDRVVAVCYALSSGKSPNATARMLDVPLNQVLEIQVAARPLLRQKERSKKAQIEHRDDSRCVYCGTARGPFTLDHVLPKSRGGTDEPSNLVLSCRSCNSAKRNRTPQEWLG